MDGFDRVLKCERELERCLRALNDEYLLIPNVDQNDAVSQEGYAFGWYLWNELYHLTTDNIMLLMVDHLYHLNAMNRDAYRRVAPLIGVFFFVCEKSHKF